MIRKLTKDDHEQVLTFLSEEAAINLFIIGDIEAFGYDADFQELWGQFEENGALQSVLLRFHDSFIPYGKDDFSITDYKVILSPHKPLKISGKSDIVEKIEDIHGIYLGTKNKMYFCECKDDTALPTTKLHTTIQLATIDDVKRIMKLRNNIEEFPHTEQSEKILRQSLETNTGRTYYIEKKGEIVASASTSAENSLSGMVVGVCTHPDYRGKGTTRLERDNSRVKTVVVTNRNYLIRGDYLFSLYWKPIRLIRWSPFVFKQRRNNYAD